MPTEIQLSRGFSCLVDESDLPLISPYRWHAVVTGNGKVYARASLPRVNGHTPRLDMHRLIVGARDGEHVDHENGDTLDNRGSNLRRVTRSQNMQNRKGASSHSKTGIRGVFWDRARQKFRAQVCLNGRTVFCKHFKTIAEAEAAVTQARASLMTHSSECKEKATPQRH